MSHYAIIRHIFLNALDISKTSALTFINTCVFVQWIQIIIYIRQNWVVCVVS